MKTLLFAATVLALNGALHACAFYKSSKEIDLGWRYAFENMPKDACLKTCYHDLGCTYVKHEQTSCYVFSNKNPTITVKDGYLIDRDTSVTSTASCSSTVSCAPPVTFQQLDKDPSVINGKCPDVTITSIYRHKYPYSSVYMYSRETVVRNWGRYTSSMLFFANKPEGLEFVPVFTHNNLRLFFGEAYNISGYTFLGVYASPREYSTGDGSVCWTAVPIREYKLTDDISYTYQSKQESNMIETEVTHTFFIYDVL